MGYLLCDKCQGNYELQPGESPDDFSDKCQCGGNLKYVESLGFDSEPEEDTNKEEPKVENEETKKENPKVKEDAKKEDSSKYCPTCGQPLPSSKKAKAPKIDTSKQQKAAKKVGIKIRWKFKRTLYGFKYP